ncbi:hypothetical protein ASPWEDRAFT_55517 [Aspergillus wentii DTO 134E9]|uniref:sterol 14alpha-demethylase n=1 Tax=Aspergillus wentii DTO 134E9 TaxID=1073089 RepID=A0A1L9R536_ASPWE|nr:uncharacterized protein ASPWEDRAFT_55517 [Aspergillus wentii DTO 134E9]OJJ30031.1 hypothetical protein ASPWEDRAFT_55517 [Aspergillus wentii DTO 134E9]
MILSLSDIYLTGCAAAFVLLLSLHLLKQTLFKDPLKPPVVFHWIPFLGSTITYGREPLRFFEDCKRKYGDIFTFILLGKPTTVYLGPAGNNFILNGNHHALSAEEIYSPLTTPVFGTDVVFDCPNAKLVQQKKFVKFGLTANALRSYVRLIANETQEFIVSHPDLQGSSGILDVPPAMAELTIYTASGSLQGKEVRHLIGSTFAKLYHDLDMGFTPINFMMPWAPLPRNRARDQAQRTMARIYMDIIQKRRANGKGLNDSEDMIWNLMSCMYKDGNILPDKEIAHMMIALLMGGHHSSSSTISYILLQLASHEDTLEDLHQEQRRVLGPSMDITFDGLQKLKLHQFTVKETLRLHNPVHSILRQVKEPLVVEGTPYIIPTSHTVLASPASSSRDPSHFPKPMKWDPHRWESKASLQGTEDDGDSSRGQSSNSAYLPFGGGRHRCIGERFAYVQLGVILAVFVQHFRLRSVSDTKNVPETDYSSLFSRPMAPAKVLWERRNAGAEIR